MLPVMDRLQQAKCSKSPTGAHWWSIYGHGANPLAYCIYCGRGRRFEAVFSAKLFDYSEQHAAATRAQAKEAALHTSYNDLGKL